MHNLKRGLVFIVMLFFVICSCSTLNNKELEKKDFSFQKFIYFQKGINNKKAFEIMKNFPIDKILKIISHKYSINIDTSEYEDFLLCEDTSKIEPASIFSAEYTWENNSKNTNIIELEYRKDMIEGSLYDKLRYYIFLKNNGKIRAEFSGDLFVNVPYLVTIAKAMDYSRVNKNNDESYVNNINKSIVDLTTGIFKNKPRESKAELAVKVGKDYPEKMKSEIKEYIRNLSPADRKKFRDDIIKYLYKVIE